MEVSGHRPALSRPNLPITGHGSWMHKSPQSKLQSSMIKTSGANDEVVRFPKLNDCAHFHYEPSLVEIGPVLVKIMSDPEAFPHPLYDTDSPFSFAVESNNRQWTFYRRYSELQDFDRQLHRCVFDRRNSHLEELPPVDHLLEISSMEIRSRLCSYFQRFSHIAGSLIICAPVLNWLEMDNRGNHLVAARNAEINTPAVGAAHVVRNYAAQANDELSMKVGDIISVIDMPTAQESIWWRGKHGFNVGYFPSHCVQLIGNNAALRSAVLYLGSNDSLKPVLEKRGKIATFLHNFLLTRPSPRILRSKGIIKERLFGCDLGEHLENVGDDVPEILRVCCDVLQKHGIVSGIYRLSGTMSNIQRLREFDACRIPNLESSRYLHDIHSVSSLLKMYFRELPNPVLTFQLYKKFMDAIAGNDSSLKILKLHDVVQLLPPPHYRTAECLIRHLAFMAERGNETGMTFQNLAIVWAPNLLRSRELEQHARKGSAGSILRSVNVQAVVVEYLMRYVDLIFSHKMPPLNRVKKFGAAPSVEDESVAGKKRRPLSASGFTLQRDANENHLLLDIGESPKGFGHSPKIPAGSGLPDLSSRKCIDVNGGPSALPPKYHTVIEIPSRSRKNSTRRGIAALFGSRRKHRPAERSQSESGGWMSHLPRSGTVRSNSSQQELCPSSNGSSRRPSATASIDVHFEKHPLRSVRSAESLCSVLSTQSDITTTPRASHVTCVEVGNDLEPMPPPKTQSLRRLPTFDCMPVATAKRPYLETNLDDIPENRVYSPAAVNPANPAAANRLSKSFDLGVGSGISKSNCYMYETSMIGSNSSNASIGAKFPPLYQSFDWTQHNSDVHFSPADRAEFCMGNSFGGDRRFPSDSIDKLLQISALDDTKNWNCVENSKIPPPLYPIANQKALGSPESPANLQPSGFSRPIQPLADRQQGGFSKSESPADRQPSGFSKSESPANLQQGGFSRPIQPLESLADRQQGGFARPLQPLNSTPLTVNCENNEPNDGAIAGSKGFRRVLSAQSSPISSLEPPASPSLFRTKFKEACFSTSLQAVDNTSLIMTQVSSDPKAIAVSCDDVTTAGSKTSSEILGENSLESELKLPESPIAAADPEAIPPGLSSPVRKHVRFLPNDAECGWGGGGLLNVYTVDPHGKPDSKLHASKSFTEASQLLQKYRALSIPKSVTVLEIDDSGGSSSDELRKSVYDNENARESEFQKQNLGSAEQNLGSVEKPKPKPRLSKLSSPPKGDLPNAGSFQNSVLPSQIKVKEPVQESGSFPMRKPRPFPRQPFSFDGVSLGFERRASSSCSPQDFSLYDNLLSSNGFKQ